MADTAGCCGGDSDEEQERQRPCTDGAPGATSKRAARMVALFQAFADRRPAAQRDLILHAEAAEQAAAARGALLTTLHQGEVDAAVLRHSCCTLPETPPPAIKSKRVILLQDQHDCVRVSVPTVECLACARKWEVQAEECGCSPASPAQPEKWYTHATLQLFGHLHTRGGLSAERASPYELGSLTARQP